MNELFAACQRGSLGRAVREVSIPVRMNELFADPLAGQLREHALAAKEHLGEGLTLDERKHLVAVARATQRRAALLPLADRPAVLAEVVRRLLDDAPSSCVALDVCVREAVTRRYAPTPAQIATAAAIVAAVTL